ncbi:Hpt domain-containing protein [Variovorax sp. YR752]|uniref:Hpt domain-containing protein n=1 Tax=Variovorax sp. YR752 TaxID=1884383 RepID=UPI0031382528
MLIRVSRLLFWTAAAAAAVALFGPPSLATVMTAFAGIGVLAAYGVWRLHLLRDRRAVLDDAAALVPVGLDEAALRDIGERMVRVIGASAGFEPALHAAAALLRAELGAREVTVHRVRAVSPPIVELVTLMADGGLGVEHRVRLERSPLGEALRAGRVAGAGSGPFALPVRQGAGWAAVIELGPVALVAPDGALEALFDLTSSHLRARADAASAAQGRDEPAACDILPLAQLDADAVSRPSDPGCDRQYAAVASPERRASGATRTGAAPPFESTTSFVPPTPPSPSLPPGSDAASGEMPRTVLDAQALERLRELDPKGENHLMERVLQAFEVSVARLGPQLEASRRSGDRAGIRHVAHTLKSSSASIGAMSLSQQCAAVEAMVRQDSTDDLDAPLAALSAEIDAVLKALRSVLDKNP